MARAPRRRDGFSHLAAGAGGHAPESLFHLQGKARVAAWLRDRYPDLEVVLEQASNASRERVADVMATSPDGRRWAFEIQYAPLSAAEWQRRSTSYRAQGIVDVWLFGHTGKQLRTVGSRVDLNPTQQAIRLAGRRVLWLNPFTAELATASTRRAVEGHLFEILASAEGELSIESLTDVELTPRGLDSPGLRRLTAQTSLYDAARLRSEQRTAAELAAQEAKEREAAAAREQAQRAAAAERRQLRAQEEAELTAEWEASPEHGEAAARWPEGAPWWITRADRVSSGFFPTAWHSILFLRYIDQLPAGTTFGVRDALEAFARHLADGRAPSVSGLTDSVRDWLYALADAGWLVREDLANPRTAFTVAGEPTIPWAPSPPPGRAARQIPASVCSRCGKPLGRLEAHRGVRTHTGCAATARRSRAQPRH